MAQKLDNTENGSFSTRLAHYLCEQAAALAAGGDPAQAKSLLLQAIATAPTAPRPRIELAQHYLEADNAGAACQLLEETLQAAPAATPLLASLLARAAKASGRIAPVLAQLRASYEQATSLDVLESLIELEVASGAAPTSTRDWYVRHLEREPSLVAAAKWIEGEKLEHEQAHPQVQRALDHATKPLLRYRCAACGFEAKQHFWQCPGCQAWDSYPARRVEEL
jgi:lipopolysaccharide biosynthesis regulator YciM